MGVAFDTNGDLIVVRRNGTVHEFGAVAGTWTELTETLLNQPGWSAVAARNGLVIIGDSTVIDRASFLVRTEGMMDPMIRGYEFVDAISGGFNLREASFGSDVAISSSWVMIGAASQEIEGVRTGAVYFFDLDAI